MFHWDFGLQKPWNVAHVAHVASPQRAMPLLHVSWLWGNQWKSWEIMGKCMGNDQVSSFIQFPNQMKRVVAELWCTTAKFAQFSASCVVCPMPCVHVDLMDASAQKVADSSAGWPLVTSHLPDFAGGRRGMLSVDYISRRDVEQDMLFPNTWSEPHKFIPQLAPIVASIVDRSRHKIIWPPNFALCSSQTWQSWHVMTCFCGSFESFAKFLHISPYFSIFLPSLSCTPIHKPSEA